MSVTLLLVSNVLVYTYIVGLVLIRRLPPRRPRAVIAGVTGFAFGFSLGVTLLQSFVDEWNVVVLLAGLLLAVNTSIVSLLLTNVAVSEKMRVAMGQHLSNLDRQPVLRPESRLLRGWFRLPTRWQVALLLSIVWFIVSAAITINTSAAGNPLPAPLRVAESVFGIAAWVVAGISLVKAWHLGIAADDTGSHGRF